MSNKKILDFIEKAARDQEFRRALLKDPAGTVKESGLDLSEETLQSLLTLTEEDYRQIQDNKVVEKDRVRAAGCGSGCSFGDIEVICACGQGYFPQ